MHAAPCLRESGHCRYTRCCAQLVRWRLFDADAKSAADGYTLFPDVATFDASGLPEFEASTWFDVLTR
jgi:hypothetical protein